MDSKAKRELRAKIPTEITATMRFSAKIANRRSNLEDHEFASSGQKKASATQSAVKQNSIARNIFSCYLFGAAKAKKRKQY